jgi:PAS domain S-box-containing protein
MQFDETKELLFNSAFFYIICTDAYGAYSYVNDHYRKRFSKVSPELVGRPFHITMHPDDIKVVEATAARCFAEPDKLFPATLRKLNGSDGYVVTNWEFKLMQEDGEFKGFFCLGYDVTELESNKKELNSAREEIDSKIRTIADIAFAQSHWVRSPLANILGLISILEHADVDANTRGLLGMLKESTERLDQVIRQVVKKTELDYSAHRGVTSGEADPQKLSIAPQELAP